MSILYVVPTRGRPDNAVRLRRAFFATATLNDTELMFAVDEDDPRWHDYKRELPRVAVGPALSGMNAVLNRHAVAMARHYDAIGFMGDDHVPQTHGWDAMLAARLTALGTGIVYGDDLVQRANLPTAVCMTSDIIQELGYMAPPELVHMYLDNFWRDLGRAVGMIEYVPEVIIEHLHPVHPDAAKKSTWDDTYERANANFTTDELRYRSYVETRFADDVKKIRDLRS